MRLLILVIGMAWTQFAMAEPELGINAIGTERKCGVGAGLGQPTGLSGKCYFAGRSFGWDAMVAWEFLNSRSGAMYVHTTAQWHPTEWEMDDIAHMSWYVGAGPYLSIWFIEVPNWVTDSGLSVGARAPVGLSFDFVDIPLQLFTEVSVNVGLVPATRIGAGGGLGARYYF